MACLRSPVDLLEPERVGAHPGDLLEVQRAPLPPAGRVHTGLHQRPAGREHPHPDLERLRLADGVVDDVDRPRDRPSAAPAAAGAAGRRPQATSSSMTARRGSCASTLAAPNSPGQLAPGRRSGPRRPPPRRGTAPAGSRPRTTPASRRRRPEPGPERGGGWRVIACRDTENGSANTAISSGIESGTGTACCRGRASARRIHRSRRPTPRCGCRADVAVGEAPAQAVVAALARRARRVDAARPARQPRVEHHPLADLEARGPSGPAPPRRPPPRGP